MVIIFGNRNYGKVDRLPGLFHVVTNFFHVYYLPLIPTGTYVMVEGAKDVGCRIGASGKSILIGYLRSFSFLGAVIATCIPLVQLMDVAQKGVGVNIPWETLGIAAACWILFALTYRISRPTLPRALELAQELGIPLDALAQHFANDPRVQTMFAELQEQDFTPPEPATTGKG